MAIVGIATDQEGAEKVRPYIDDIGVSYPILLDPEAITTAMFGVVEGYPKTFILDTQGLLYSSYLGAQQKSVFEDDLRYLLTAPPSEAASQAEALAAAEPDR